MYISEDEIRKLLTYEALIPAIRQALIDYSAGLVIQPPRTIMRTAISEDRRRDGWFAVMPVRELYRDLLISVTSFFRDPDSFDALGKLLADRLNRRNKDDDPIRVWVPGCATGEEVYSLAMLLFEILQERQLPVPIQLFGTDISDLALDRARNGLYPVSIKDDITPERLRRFFSKVDSGYQINKSIANAAFSPAMTSPLIHPSQTSTW